MRLIDADVLKELLLHYVGWLKETSIKSGIDDYTQGIIDGIFKAIDTTERKLPAVEKRQHGHWIKNVVGIPKCSCCGCIAPCEGDSYTVTYYCPHCGAKMDEVTDDGQ